MTLKVPSRRGFLLGLGAITLATPAIVRLESLMPVKIVPATEADLAKLGHFSTELAQAESWAATQGSIEVDGKRFFLRAQIGMPRNMNNSTNPNLTDDLIKRFVREGILEAKDTDHGEWNNQPLKRLIVPKHWVQDYVSDLSSPRDPRTYRSPRYVRS